MVGATRYRAVIEYDGTAYYGFQRQIASQPTVQSRVEEALGQFAPRPVAITGAGRTDRGVHARGQVISFELAWQHGPEALHRALNANLPQDIAVLAVAETEGTFHPRYDARHRTYTYNIYNGSVRRPLLRRQSWHVRQPLDVAVMNRVAGRLVGTHDFATFGQPTSGESTLREVFQAEWQRQDDCVIFTIIANAFLYRMVRSLVGTMTAVGVGSWTAAAFVDAFAARERGQAATTAPPQGLCLQAVAYE